MFLTILVAWLALAGLAALFLYCCSRVSNGRDRELADEDFAAELPRPTDRRVDRDTGATAGDGSAPLRPSSSPSLTF